MTGQAQIIGGIVQQANLQGRFLNGEPITLQISPGSGGIREMRVVGNDSGAALRAANLYSKISGGSIDFQAKLHAAPATGIQQGKLVVRNFLVRNETALGDINRGSNKRNTGPSKQALRFSKLTIPFSTDNNFVRIGDALVKGPQLGASAQGMIRKTDGRMDIGGTIIPAYALNAAVGEIPLVGTILTGGRGQGVFGLNFALKGTMRSPKFQINPVSAIAPGILRRMFQIGGGGVAADGTPAKKERSTPTSKTDQ